MTGVHREPLSFVGVVAVSASLCLSGFSCSRVNSSVEQKEQAPTVLLAISAPPASSASSAALSGASWTLNRDAVPPSELVNRLSADVHALSVFRPPGSRGWQQVQKSLIEQLSTLPFEVEKQEFSNPPGRNIVGKKAGAARADEFVIISAHYDHLEGCLGADDNASGVAVALSVARALSSESFERSLVIAFWDREEEGLVGSLAYAEQARKRGLKVHAMISLDSVGFASHRPESQRVPDALGVVLPDLVDRLEKNQNRADFIAVLGDDESQPAISAFEQAGAQRGLLVVGAGLSKMARVVLNDTARSDHASFWLHGFPGVLVTDTANFRNPRYHCGFGQDSADTLDYDFLARVAQTTQDAARVLLSGP